MFDCGIGREVLLSIVRHIQMDLNVCMSVIFHGQITVSIEAYVFHVYIDYLLVLSDWL